LWSIRNIVVVPIDLSGGSSAAIVLATMKVHEIKSLTQSPLKHIDDCKKKHQNTQWLTSWYLKQLQKSSDVTCMTLSLKNTTHKVY